MLGILCEMGLVVYKLFMFFITENSFIFQFYAMAFIQTDALTLTGFYSLNVGSKLDVEKDQILLLMSLYQTRKGCE